MNIFYVDSDPVQAARDLCDKHVVKMPTETGQMLCHVLYNNNLLAINKKSKSIAKHPATLWCCESAENFEWACQHGYALCEEYTSRYKKFHKAYATIQCCHLFKSDISFPRVGFSDPPLCMPDERKLETAVDSYRNYYIIDKAEMAKWQYSKVPAWAVTLIL